jgi:hypothetical protein
MNGTLLITQLRKNMKLIVSIIAVTAFYLVIMVITAEFMQNEAMLDFFRAFGMPEEELEMLKKQMTPLNFMASGFFSLYYPLFLMFTYIKLVSVYIVKPTENSVLSCYLSMPISRTKYAATTAVSLTAVILSTGVIAYIAGIATFAVRGTEINQLNYLNIVATATLSALAMAFISLALGFIFAGTKYKSLYLSVPILMLFAAMFYSMADWLMWLRYVTPLGWADFGAIAEGSFNLWWLVYLGCAAVVGVCLYLTLHFFKRRNLSI